MSWERHEDPYYTRAEHSDRWSSATVSLDDDGGISVDAEQGSGYMREHVTVRIPCEVVDWLIAQRAKRGERGT